jgi:tyrosine-protein phosphatase YwqE
MANKKITTNDDLAIMIEKGFEENTKEHQQIFKILDKHAVILIDHTERLKKLEKNQKLILTKLEGIVYRREFEELETRLKRVEAKLGIE